MVGGLDLASELHSKVGVFYGIVVTEKKKKNFFNFLL